MKILEERKPLLAQAQKSAVDLQAYYEGLAHQATILCALLEQPSVQEFYAKLEAVAADCEAATAWCAFYRSSLQVILYRKVEQIAEVLPLLERLESDVFQQDLNWKSSDKQEGRSFTAAIRLAEAEDLSSGQLPTTLSVEVMALVDAGNKESCIRVVDGVEVFHSTETHYRWVCKD